MWAPCFENEGLKCFKHLYITASNAAHYLCCQDLRKQLKEHATAHIRKQLCLPLWKLGLNRQLFERESRETSVTRTSKSCLFFWGLKCILQKKWERTKSFLLARCLQSFGWKFQIPVFESSVQLFHLNTIMLNRDESVRQNLKWNGWEQDA